MKLDDVKKGLRVTITHLWPPNYFYVVQKNLDCRKEGVTGVVMGHVLGHGGDLWWVKHDGTTDVGAYRFTEFEPIDQDIVPAYSVLDQVVDERNALRDEVAELKRKLAEVEGERDALRELNAEMLTALKSANEHFSRFMKDDAYIGDYPIVFEIRNAIAKAEKLNSPVK